MSGLNYSELTYSRPTGTYIYPSWAIAVGWVLACSTAAAIPIIAVYKIVEYVFILDWVRIVSYNHTYTGT
jgi:solute carrier family 6 GABA transporter-like protein 6/8/11/12/13